jgi:uncharacterized protein (TIGR03435 family)
MLVATIAAQTPDSRLAFEVVSIKLNKSAERNNGAATQPGGRWEATNISLYQILRNSYGMTDAQIIGGPDWIKNDRYDIVAKMPAEALNGQTGEPRSRAVVNDILRNLATDRFHVIVHSETREVTVVSMVVAHPDGPLGPRLVHATNADADCKNRNASSFNGSDPFKTLPPCGTIFGPSRMAARGITMDNFASLTAVSLGVNPIVHNDTGLTGPFNIDLEFTRTPLDTQGADAGSPPSVLTAFQEQLGLKLVTKRQPADVLVIDRADHPTED